MKRLGTGLAVAALSIVSACGAGTLDVKGTMTLNSNFRAPIGETDCVATGGYADVGEGVDVVVSDADGKKVGLGKLDAGKLNEDQSACVFPFTVSKVPGDGSIYSVDVAGRGQVNFDKGVAESVEVGLS